mmetsp:Transcript_29590/g.58104  ORF Transcript_29590/g.58104 Transcript_29590/m.58104 type:complete len:137 (+) Transcript_29590:1007-1417(+)
MRMCASAASCKLLNEQVRTHALCLFAAGMCIPVHPFLFLRVLASAAVCIYSQSDSFILPSRFLATHMRFLTMLGNQGCNSEASAGVASVKFLTWQLCACSLSLRRSDWQKKLTNSRGVSGKAQLAERPSGQTVRIS